MKNVYIVELTTQQQTTIRQALRDTFKELGYKDNERNELINRGMNSKTHDLIDTINIETILQGGTNNGK